MRASYLFTVAISLAIASAQTTKDPFPSHINSTDDVILVKSVDFAQIPFAGTEAPRLMLLINEPGTHRLFVNTMRGPIYSVSYDGHSVKEYIDINAPQWSIDVHFSSHDSGFQSFAFHPEFNQPGKPGYGKFYTYTDTSNMKPQADFLPKGKGHAHDTVLLEWTAKNPAAATYDGGPPRELFRTAKPFPIHNGGQLAFNPLAKPGAEDYGLLYAGVADGGSGGDPYKHAQDLSVAFGKILRIDPLGHNSRNGNYGIPPSNPFVKNPKPGAIGEIYAYGCRNPQRFSWDPKNGNMFLADIGQDVVEKVTLVTPGANLGWNVWEGSFRYAGHQVETGDRASDPTVTYPILEFDHTDPLLKSAVAVTGVYAYRSKAIPKLTGKLIFGDNPTGELFYVDADHLPKGGQDAIRRIMIADGGAETTLLSLVQKKNQQQGKPPATRADMRMNLGPHGEIFLTNKMDGYIRRLAEAEPLPPLVRQAAPGVYYRLPEDDKKIIATTSWIEFRDFLVVIDANFPWGAKALLSDLKKTSSKPIRFVLDTHYHGDHSWGNGVFAAMGATIIASDDTAADSIARNTPGWAKDTGTGDFDLKQYTLVHPQLTFHDKLVIDDGERRLELLREGPGHTRGDVVAWLPKERIVFTGDLCTTRAQNNLSDPGMDPDGWVRILGRLIDLNPAIVIPGHGTQGTVDALKGQQAFLSAIMQGVQAGIAKQQSAAQIFTTIDFTKYKPWSDNDTRNRNAVNAMYEKLK